MSLQFNNISFSDVRANDIICFDYGAVKSGQQTRIGTVVAIEDDSFTIVDETANREYRRFSYPYISNLARVESAKTTISAPQKPTAAPNFNFVVNVSL